MRAIACVAGLMVVAGCRGAPSALVDASSDAPRDGGGDAGVEVRVSFDRPFGVEGEQPTHLVAAGPDRLLAVTTAAVYQLDGEGRVLHREPLPATSTGSVAALASARWDGVGLGAAVRWGNDASKAAGTYLALSDGKGAFSPASMIALGKVGSTARSDWDPAAGQHVALFSENADGKLRLRVTRAPRVGPASTGTLVDGLPLATTLGGWRSQSGASALCTVEPGGRVRLRTFDAKGVGQVLDLVDPGQQALGSCQLADSGRSTLVAWTREAPPPETIDAGAVDLGPGFITFNLPVAQVVDPSGKALPAALRLSLYPYTAQVQTAVWHASRYLVLLRTTFRGGRLVLTALDEAGVLLFRDVEIPLVYEPGSVLAAALTATETDYAVVYASRRPWDAGVLRLVRFTLEPG